MINKIAFATIIFFLPIYFILAQNINGVVIDKKTGEPIYSVAVKEKELIMEQSPTWMEHILFNVKIILS